MLWVRLSINLKRWYSLNFHFIEGGVCSWKWSAGQDQSCMIYPRKINMSPKKGPSKTAWVKQNGTLVLSISRAADEHKSCTHLMQKAPSQFKSDQIYKLSLVVLVDKITGPDSLNVRKWTHQIQLNFLQKTKHLGGQIAPRHSSVFTIPNQVSRLKWVATKRQQFPVPPHIQLSRQRNT